MNTETLPDQASIFSKVAADLASGMPAFQKIEIHFASGDDLRRWAAQFEVDIPAAAGQPYPDLANPAASDEWLIVEQREWRGLKVLLHSLEPITDEQRQQWIDSGRAASAARYKAERAAAEAGLAYSREHHDADDPRPVSPARGGQPHVVAVTDDGLVDETPADPVTVYFSFGHGQHDPDTNEHLLDKYVTIVGPSYDACREAMFASKYGDRWAFEYPDDGPATAEWIPRWTEHERIVLAAAEPVSESR